MSANPRPGLRVTPVRPIWPPANTLPARANRRGRLVRRALVTADLVGLTSAFLCAVLIYGSRDTSTDSVPLHWELVLLLSTLPGWIFLAKLQGLYDRDEEQAGHTTVDDLIGILKLVTIGSWLFFVITWWTSIASPFPSKLIGFWAFAIVFVVLARLTARAVCRRRPQFVQNALIVGSGETAQVLAGKFRARRDYGVNFVGYVDLDPAPGVAAEDYLGDYDRLVSLVAQHDVERVIVEFPVIPREQLANLIRDLRRRDVQIDLLPRLYDLVAPGADVHAVEGLPMIGLPPVRAERTLRAFKRGTDILGSACALLLLAPVFAWVALRIKLDTPGPVLYRHERVGEGGRTFKLIKFRTMYLEYCAGAAYGGAAADSALSQILDDPVRRLEFEQNQKLVADVRVTPFGRFIRRLSLDELPQLVNVLLGHMSLVGPRPVTAAELSRYEPDVDTFLLFRPGVTGYWQINGRSDTTWEDRVRLDLSYIHGWSPKLDFLILGKTFWVLITGRGAY